MPSYELKDLMVLRDATMDDFGYQIDQYSHCPEGEVEICHIANYGMLHPRGIGEKPVFYFRHQEVDRTRWAGIVDLGDGPLSPQVGGHFNDLAQKDVPTVPYALINENPPIYGFKGADDSWEITYDNLVSSWREGKQGEILNVKAEPFGPSLFAYTKSAFCFNWQFQPVIITGTYEGKPVVGMGQYDRGYTSREANWAKTNGVSKDKATTYCLQIFTGMIICSACGKNYKHVKNHGMSRWVCPTYVADGKTACQSKQIPEEIIIRLACDLFGWNSFDEEAFRQTVDHVTAIYPHTLVFHLRDGWEVKQEWQNRSRSESWTPEMRTRAAEAARRREYGKNGH